MSPLRKLLPHPLLSLGLLLVWLLLVNEFSVGHAVLGAMLGVAIPLLTGGLEVGAWRVRQPLRLLWFILRIFHDVVLANLLVARLVLGPVERLQPAFIEVPIQLDHELAIFLLASAISLAPGTVAAHLSPDRRRLVVHVLHCTDEQALIAEIKSRYERPLKEIFAC
ncbi:Na+/H+ antiporter subunit E [Pseudomonas oryzae]|uniref:Multisubunit potassium/proton antiporter, PhaE subunit n=1 Tax=Pseudomonas oryzae TaxID=1392877 RepID=A0A1H1T3D9_9PSED|nr:Na+/H+ antiporter subunit E [Pseudomonas oryzae]SDS54496.1 multisubunit potassium/proton antiporter, PhaE subunit [Pseudomonas oryzae]